MGVEKFGFLIWVSCLICLCHGYVPVNNYLINCGSSTNVTVTGRVFISDKLASNLLTSPNEILAASNRNSNSDIYQTARIFTGVSKYRFSVTRGRHWVRLHFNPFQYQNFQMGSAKFSVSSQTHVLLSDFTGKSRVMKEYSLSVAADHLELTFTPLGDSFAFVNALEVVSVPDTLISGDPSFVGSPGKFQGMSWQALETVYRVNMGGPRVTPSNDTLSRIWEPDSEFIVEKNLVKIVSKIASVNYVPGFATEETAPRTVYGTCTEMNSADNPSSKFNVTWDFDVDPGFQYFLRFHFCDIVSKALNQLYFNLYVDSMLVVEHLDLSSYLSNTLSGAYSMDFVTGSAKQTKRIRVSIGPSSLHTDYPNAILNGLEIMKMNNSKSQLSNGTFLPSGSSSTTKKNVGMIVGVTVGSFLALVVLGGFFLLYKKRGRDPDDHSKTWIPLSSNGTTSSSNGTTIANPTLTREMVNLAEWAMKWQKKGHLEHIIDPSLRGKIRPDSLRKFGETGEKCLADYGVDRPSMGDVLWNLEYALQLQEAVIDGDPEDSTNMIGELPLRFNDYNHGDTSVNVSVAKEGQFDEEESSVDDSSGVSMSKVFSQLVKSEGR
ncbi:unnamed protein product [Arabidopsis arenosa]|uniref:Malectin-like domain-containing protein n=1 Tax=Arabidopsis arenosa TaxID=38785 RepID=A0A8S2B995_ARAAE|nr:unnamed protein product [Arabidopsis arenosa]